MARRGVKAMERSQRNKKKARERFKRYSTNYRHLAATGDKAMVKAWREANKIREIWMEPERLLTIPEEEEPPSKPARPQTEAMLRPLGKKPNQVDRN